MIYTKREKLEITAGAVRHQLRKTRCLDDFLAQNAQERRATVVEILNEIYYNGLRKGETVASETAGELLHSSQRQLQAFVRLVANG